MPALTKKQAVTKAGVTPAYLDRVLDLGIVEPDQDGLFSPGQIRRVQFVHALDDAGIPLDGLARAMSSGDISLDFLEAEAYERFAALTDETFEQASARTGVPFELLAVIREAIGLPQPSPTDHLREDELDAITFLQAQIKFGFRPVAIERLLRVTGESLRRITEQEADWWRTEVLEPGYRAGETGKQLDERFGGVRAEELSRLGERGIVALYHARQAYAWTSNIIAGLEGELARLGLYSRLVKPPAICFLDITGYTRLTQERGDEAAAKLAGDLGRLVQRVSSAQHGKPIKWLGDGVMLFFQEPEHAVEAALQMVDGVSSVELPPAHVGIDAGPVLFQEGDYFGTTVNVAARIADYARPGEVLVTQAVVDASEGDARFVRIGPVELKGVQGAMTLHAAHRIG